MAASFRPAGEASLLSHPSGIPIGEAGSLSLPVARLEPQPLPIILVYVPCALERELHSGGLASGCHAWDHNGMACMGLWVVNHAAAPFPARGQQP